MIAQILWLGCTVAEVSCPTKYFPEASSINFRRSLRYGIGCLATGLEYIPLGTFAWATALGVFPACFLYALAGTQIESVSSVGNLMSPRPLMSLLFLALAALIPAVWKKARHQAG